MLPDFYAFCLPFLFSDIDEFINVARDPEVSAKANEIMNSKGITLIGFSSGESRGYLNTQHTVRTPPILLVRRSASRPAPSTSIPLKLWVPSLHHGLLRGLLCPAAGRCRR